jgi:DNA-directed RNA polymerase subunit H (RpoH/RPB5)
LGEIIQFEKLVEQALLNKKFKKNNPTNLRTQKSTAKMKDFTIIHSDAEGKMIKSYHISNTTLPIAFKEFISSKLHKKIVEGDMVQIFRGHIIFN